MSQPSWSDSARAALAPRPSDPPRPPVRVALLGIGQELRGDDGAGPAVARGLTAALPALPYLLALDAGPAPESLTGPLRRFRPDVVVLVDAAQLGEPAGTVCWLAADQARGLVASSHTMPPTLLAEYLAGELGCLVVLLGIQPLDTVFGARLSPAVRDSVRRVICELAALLAPGGRDDTGGRAGGTFGPLPLPDGPRGAQRRIAHSTEEQHWQAIDPAAAQTLRAAKATRQELVMG